VNAIQLRLLAISLGAFCVEAYGQNPTTNEELDPGQGASCSKRFGNRGACRTSMVALVSVPAAYNMKQLDLVGYLAVENGAIVVYSNRDAFVWGDSMQSVELVGPSESLRASAENWAFRYVRIGGLFRAGDAAMATTARAGVLENAEIYSPVHERPEGAQFAEPHIRLDSEEMPRR